MSGLLIRVPTSFNNPDLPMLEASGIMPGQGGALLFLEPGNPVNPWAAGWLNQGQSVPNLAYDQARALIPSGTEASLGVTSDRLSGWQNDGVGSLQEITAKGGAHFVQSQAVIGDQGRVFRFVAGSALDAYLAANKNHAYYLAVWGRVTRPMLTPGNIGRLYRVGRWGNDAYMPQWGMAAAGSTVSLMERETYVTDTDFENMRGGTVAPFFSSHAVSQFDPLGGVALMPFFSLNSFAAGSSADSGKAPSLILYGVYIEDLTVSGRDYAAVNALVRGKFEREVVTPGGRYYGDTYTDPATIP